MFQCSAALMWWVPLSCWIQSPGWSSQRSVTGFFNGKAAPIGKSTKTLKFPQWKPLIFCQLREARKDRNIVWGSRECEFNSTDRIRLYTESLSVCVCVVCVCVCVCVCVRQNLILNTVVPDWVKSTEERNGPGF